MIVPSILICAAIVVSIYAISIIVLDLISLSAVWKSNRNASSNESCHFTCKPLINNPQIKLMRALDSVIPEVFGPGALVLSQMPYSEFLKAKDSLTHEQINLKCADFVVVDAKLEVRCAIECLGLKHNGHGKKSRENARLQGFEKRAACASASIPFVEIPTKFSPKMLKDLLEEARTIHAGF
jgi:hypothetical protein